MKRKWIKSILCGLLSLLMLTASLPAYAQGENNVAEKGVKYSPLAKYFKEEQITPKFINYIKNGGKGYMPSPTDYSYLTQSYLKMNAKKRASSLPQRFDLREYGKVGAVGNQNETGICWAYSALGSAAASIAEQFPNEVFSPIHTAYFSYRGDEENEFTMGADPYTNGGNDFAATSTLAAWKGPVPYSLAPTPKSGYPTDPPESLRFKAYWHLQDTHVMPTTYLDVSPEEAIQIQNVIKNYISTSNPITIFFKASDSVNALNFDTDSYYNSENSGTDHVALLIGWDDNYPKENFLEGNQPKNNGAWLVKNSWGVDSPNDGYYWISYEDKTLNFGYSYFLEGADNYASNYQYDTLGGFISMCIPDSREELTSAKAANIFTAEDDEQLEAVSFYTTDVGTQYSISVYTNVQDGNPESGTLKLSGQTGVEEYAGYHTIELDEPIMLKKGEQFSIIVKLKNPVFKFPLSVEMCIVQTPDDVPQYMGNGGESYVYAGGTWYDIVGIVDDNIYITNVCIKGFTNPLPESKTAVGNVRFSKMAGPVKNGTEIELSAHGADDIYYSVNGGEFAKYEVPLTMKFDKSQSSINIAAYAVKNGRQGNIVEKRYIQATAMLTELTMNIADKKSSFDPTIVYSPPIYVYNTTDSVSFKATSTDSIYLNGEPLESLKWSGEVPLTPGEITTVSIVTSGEGKKTNDLHIRFYRSLLEFDYENETVSYDEAKYVLTDKNNNVIASGDVITDLISTAEEYPLEIKNLETGEIMDEYIPKRPSLKDLEIDYFYETTKASFSPAYIYSPNPDMSDAIACDYNFIPLTPGQNVYIQKIVYDNNFKGEIYKLEVPERPAAPIVNVIDTTSSSVKLTEVDGAIYHIIDDEDWQFSSEFTELTPNTEYTFEVCCDATDEAFYSESAFVTVKTDCPDVNPSDYSFEVKYVDINGTPIPGGKTIAFDETGAYSREDIPIPSGYKAIVPSEPNYDWSYPTALEFIDGKWTVTNPIVEIVVEKINDDAPNGTDKPTDKPTDNPDIPNTGIEKDICICAVSLLAVSCLSAAAVKKRKKLIR